MNLWTICTCLVIGGACHLSASEPLDTKSGKEEPLSQQIVEALKPFFVHINDNYWGIAHGDQCCSLACVKCDKIKTDWKEFYERGLPYGSSKWFCKEHAYAFFQLTKNLATAAEKKGIEFEKLYEEALIPIRTLEKQLIGELASLHPDRKSESWVYLN